MPWTSARWENAMPDDDAKQQGNAFRWSAGGWSGGLVGATAWIALMGGLLLFDAPGLGALVLAIAVVPNVVGMILWRMRERVRIDPAVQALDERSPPCSCPLDM